MEAQAGPAGTEKPATTVEGHYERIEAAERAREALLARPRFSLRLQIYIAFLVAFLLATGVATALVVVVYQVEGKIRFLEIANEYAMQVEEARRFEKNYFLYGTGLDAARQAVYQATRILNRNTRELTQIMGSARHSIALENIERYEKLVEQLSQIERGPKGPDLELKKKELEPKLRKQGSKMVSHAQDLLERERASMAAAISRSRNIHIYSLVLLLLSTVAIAYVLGSRLLGNISRFELYAGRIAAGDFTPITPARRYRDEFTDLALSINQMIQELESHEAVLIQSHKMRAVGTLTAGVAHELNNPLNNITLTTHMLMEDYDSLPDEERKEMVSDVIQEADRAKSIVSNLLDFARESGTQLEPLDLARLVEDTITLAQNQIKLSGIKIEFNATGSLPRIHGDSQQLRQVFLNLILNSIAASRKGDKIEVLVLPADEPREVAVKVIDFGTGIPEHILGRIFDPFFTTKSKGKGTGLGLSVSQGIVAKHGGRIRVSSKEGQGSTFTVTLPVTTIPSKAVA